MSDPGDDNHALLIIDGVDDPVVADSDSIVVSAGEPDNARRAGIDCESVDCGTDSVTEGALQAAVRARRRRVEPDVVFALRLARYSRTSAQGAAASGSSRARRAATLSSRYSRRSRSSA